MVQVLCEVMAPVIQERVCPRPYLYFCAGAIGIAAQGRRDRPSPSHQEMGSIRYGLIQRILVLVAIVADQPRYALRHQFVTDGSSYHQLQKQLGILVGN